MQIGWWWPRPDCCAPDSPARSSWSRHSDHTSHGKSVHMLSENVFMRNFRDILFYCSILVPFIGSKQNANLNKLLGYPVGKNIVDKENIFCNLGNFFVILFGVKKFFSFKYFCFFILSPIHCYTEGMRPFSFCTPNRWVCADALSKNPRLPRAQETQCWRNGPAKILKIGLPYHPFLGNQTINFVVPKI